MSGIVSYGAYIPFNRLKRETIGAALESRGGKGEKSVASFDEDTVTMAVEAATSALASVDADSIHALHFATTNPPYQEKLNASTVHAALNLPSSVRAQDAAGSIRAGMSTFITAGEGAAAGNALVTMSDIRMGAPEGAAELNGGDGAAAFVLGTDNILAEIEAVYSETMEHQALWRLPGEKFARTWEDRFALTQVYGPLLASGAKGLLEKAGIEPHSIHAIVIDVPNIRAASGLIKSYNLDPDRIVDPLMAVVGHTGTAHAGLMLASALDTAKPGDRIAVLSVSNGVDGILLKATDAIADFKPARTVEQLIASKRNNLAYNRYLKWRGILESEPPRRPDPARPAGPPVFRARNWKFGFIGSECTACGTRQLPPQKVCVKCGATNQMKEVPYADEIGKIATFTLDRLAYTLNPPMVMAIVDFDCGGRVELEITDCDPENVAIGDEIELTFRRLFTADGIHNYFWKARPLR
jgi:hydroxymethylglutaryl-CoA synthase